jgi:hypothetical protein
MDISIAQGRRLATLEKEKQGSGLGGQLRRGGGLAGAGVVNVLFAYKVDISGRLAPGHPASAARPDPRAVARPVFGFPVQCPHVLLPPCLYRALGPDLTMHACEGNYHAHCHQRQAKPSHALLLPACCC